MDIEHHRSTRQPATPARRATQRPESRPAVRTAVRTAVTLLVACVLAGCAPTPPAPPATTTSTTPGASTTTTVPVTTVPVTTVPVTTVPVTTVLLDEQFDTGALDTGAWRSYHNDYGAGNGELACLTPDNVDVTGGVLRIISRAQMTPCPRAATKHFASGFVASREAGRYYPLYGRYEARIRVTHAQGIWPAFWLRHRNGSATAEVDVMEYFHSQVPGKVTQTLHLPATRGYSVAKRSTPTEAPTAALGAWHTYAVDITRTPGGGVRFEFSVDGVSTVAYTDHDPTWAAAAPEDATWDIALNVAVGGRWAGHPQLQLGYLPDLARCSLTNAAPPGLDPAACPSTGLRFASLPSTAEVDWVRVVAPPR